MENASKALIIAGSILLSILIIALGMYIFSSSSSTSDVSVLSETEVQTYNSKFDKYEKEQLGSNVSALIRALRSNATSNKGTMEKIPTVGFYGSATGAAAQTLDVNAASTTAANANPIIAGRTNAVLTTAANGTLDAYNNALTAMSNAVEKSHRYTVCFTYDANGLINRIAIGYNAITLNN